MVLGGITAMQRSHLVVIGGIVNAQRYRHEITQLPFLNQHGQQDNARPHLARLVHQHRVQNNVKVLPWPFYLPTCPLMMSGTRWIDVHCSHPIHFRTCGTHLFGSGMPYQCYMPRLVGSMRRKCPEFIQAHGAHKLLTCEMTFLVFHLYDVIGRYDSCININLCASHTDCFFK